MIGPIQGAQIVIRHGISNISRGPNPYLPWVCTDCIRQHTARQRLFELISFPTPMSSYCFLKALLPIPKRRIPAPRKSRVTGQGKGQPSNGLGFPANINIESRIKNAPDIIKSHLDTVIMVRLLLCNYYIYRMYKGAAAELWVGPVQLMEFYMDMSQKKAFFSLGGYF